MTSNLNSIQLSWIINGLVLFLAISFSIGILLKVKFADKGYKLLFVVYILFWIPLMLTRENTGNIQKAFDPDNIYLWIPLTSYGLIGIFIRIFGDYFTYKFMSRKSLIYFALFIQIITYLPILFVQNTLTNVIQSLGVGIGASCVGTYQLLFNEQYGKAKQFLTVSILSIPPLMADIISSPISALFRSNNVYDTNTLKYIWLLGLGFVVSCIILTFFIKENRQLLFLDNKVKKPLSGSKQIFYFVLLSIVGLLIMFVKFANSGATAILHIQKLSGDTSGPYEAYSSLIFNVGQLIGGVLTGMILMNKLGKFQTFTIGASIWIVYQILTIFIANPFLYMTIHSLNGLSYGILYNLIMIFVLELFFLNTKKITPMGLYQGILCIGISASYAFVGLIKKELKDLDWSQYQHKMVIINSILIAAIIVSYALYCWYYFANQWLNSKKQNNI